MWELIKNKQLLIGLFLTYFILHQGNDKNIFGTMEKQFNLGHTLIKH